MSSHSVRLMSIALACMLYAAAAPAQMANMRGDGPAPVPKPWSISRLDPGLDALIAPDAQVEWVASGFGLNEGTTWVRDDHGSGFLLVGGLLDNVLYKIAPDNTVSVFMEKAGYSGDDVENVGAQTRAGRSHVLLIGPSCSGVDPQGRILWCADDDRRVMRLEADGRHTVLSEGVGGKRFNGPNDISIKSDGAVYMTDNDFGLRGAMKSPVKELQDAVWLIKDGRTVQLLTDQQLGGIPNGITLSADEKYLYLSAFNKMMRYVVKPDDTLGEGTLFTQGAGIGDGMRCDSQGNIYSTGGAGPGLVRVTAPSGTLLGTINLPVLGAEPKKQICATNVAFGDRDGKTLYIAACDAVYKIRLKVAGVLEGPAH
ncbi:MAG TPA: SMP-30/gluconolactonase/LRE family protein [Steroidobacteraceae bacterium]|jgi:gluconolactonase|nr:SMP-30/gluconolactonase/LRE family protein [Steroidobacteraceae bacterium]